VSVATFLPLTPRLTKNTNSGRCGSAPRFQVQVRPSLIDGKGVFARSAIKARQKLGELGGEIISQPEADKRASGRRRIAIVELDHGKAIDASKHGNEFRYVNHSCSPNTFIRIFGGRVEFYALRTIRRGEELTCDYGETQHNGTHRCQCGSGNCRGFI
jgi:SET domain-containing protein